MAKIENELRDFVRYQARRALKQTLAALPKRLRKTRQEIRSLRKEVQGLSRQIQALTGTKKKAAIIQPATKEALGNARYSSRSLKSMRRKLGITQKDLAQLLEVSPLTVTSWETGKSRPREGKLALIVALRSIDKARVNEALGRIGEDKSGDTGKQRTRIKPKEIKPSDIKKIRAEAGLTQEKMAKKLGVSENTVGNWETGSARPRGKNLEKLLKMRGD